MKRRWVIVLAVVFGIVTGLGTAWIVEAQTQQLTTSVVSINNSGLGGTAWFTDVGGGKTQVEIRLTDAGPGPLPVHIHNGPCADLDPVPQIPLMDIRNGASTTELGQSFQQLTAAPSFICIHKSAEELPVIIGCADVVDVMMASQVAPPRAGNTGSASLVGLCVGLAAFSLVLAGAGRVLGHGV